MCVHKLSPPLCQSLEPFFYRDLPGVKEWNKNTQMFQDIHSNKKPKRKEKLIITIKFRSSMFPMTRVYTSAAVREVLMNHVALQWRV